MTTGKLSCVILFSICIHQVRAQDSTLLNMLNDSMTVNAKPDYVKGTFKANHIVNMQTVEAPAHGALNFAIQHRFGRLNSGSYNLFGLDNATLRLGFDYGITDRLAVGIGRSSYLKTYDGYLKYKLLLQKKGVSSFPFTLSVLGTVSNYTFHIDGSDQINAGYRTSYTAQVLIARKFNSRLSLELIPTYLHYNIPSSQQQQEGMQILGVNDKSNVFALAMGGRFKISKRMSINAEYDYLPTGQIVDPVAGDKVRNSFSLGWDIETGGHVFQLVFSNSQSMTETQYITQTTGSWGKGDIYFGFNLSRVFNLKKKK